MEEFQKDNPDIKVNVVRESTGTMAAKMMAEKDNPQADFLFEMAATVALNMEAEGMFHEYTPIGMDKIDQRYVDKSAPVTWVGNYGWAGCICWNRIEAENHGLPKPKTWAELANPIYKGHISMPNPASSGTERLYLICPGKRPLPSEVTFSLKKLFADFMILSMSARVFFSFAPSPTPENLGAAVVASVAIIAVVTANSASDCPFLPFNLFSNLICLPFNFISSPY